MGSTVRNIAIFFTAIIILLVISCGIIEPFGVSPKECASIALDLGMNSAIQPDKIFVNVTAKNYNQSKEAPYYHPEGLEFTGIPLGDADIYVEAKWGDVKLLDGNTFMNLHSGNNQVHVPLNNVLIAYHISPDQENQFDKNANATTPFWDILAGRNSATLEKGGASANAIVTAALGDDALYFLVALNDENFITGDVVAGPQDEWINDVFVLYFCISSTYQQNFYNSCYRIQCQMGEADPSLGKIHLKGINTSPQVDFMNTIANFQEIEAKVFEVAANTRILEMRVPKEKIGIGGIGKPGDKFAMAIRYNNVDTQDQTNEDKIDWKNFMNNPLEKPDPWGNLEFQ